VAAGKLDATTSTEVIQELLHVLRRRGRASEALSLSRKALALVPEVLPVTGEVMALACDLLERHPNLPTRDAIHAATMQNHGLARIASADRHFDSIEGIERLAVFVGGGEH
jgi:predicted nucleic acid-binding protein